MREQIRIENILQFIEENSTIIVDNIDFESLEAYIFLKSQFESSNVSKNYFFQFVYRSFYRLDNAGLTREFKDDFFKILEEFRNVSVIDYELILKRLDKFPNIKGQNSFQWSFVTKMAHTIDNNRAIYDNEVENVFNLPSIYSRPTFEKKLILSIANLNIIQNNYEVILEKNLLPLTFTKFDNKFHNYDLSEIKKMDFIFWSSGKIKKKIDEN